MAIPLGLLWVSNDNTVTRDATKKPMFTFIVI